MRPSLSLVVDGLELAAVLFTGCGGLSAADTKSLQDSVRVEVDAMQLCAIGQTCDAAQVRADMRAARCSDSSILKRHNETVPAGGIDGCAPQ